MVLNAAEKQPPPEEWNSCLSWLGTTLFRIDESAVCRGVSGERLSSAPVGKPLREIVSFPEVDRLTLRQVLANPGESVFPAVLTGTAVRCRCRLSAVDQAGERWLWIQPEPVPVEGSRQLDAAFQNHDAPSPADAAGSSRLAEPDLAMEVRRVCHNLNNVFLALRCVCEGVSMSTGNTIVRADDLLEQAAQQVNELAGLSRGSLNAPHTPPKLE